MGALSLPLAVIGRVMLGLYFLAPGIGKLTGFAVMQAYMATHGVPFTAALLTLAAALQIGGGLALIAGWRTHQVALMFAGMVLVINLLMHDFWNVYASTTQAHELQNFIKNLGIFAGLLVLAAHGAPRGSIDGRRGVRSPAR